MLVVNTVVSALPALTMILLLERLQSCSSFEFPKLPTIDNFKKLFPKSPVPPANLLGIGGGGGALNAGDTVAIFGASGNVGKLIALRLSDTYNVNGIVRDASSVQEFFKGRDNIRLFESDLLSELKSDQQCPESLRSALSNANAIVICTGTTAFPTKAWSSEDKEITFDVLRALADSKFNLLAAVSKLDAKYYNTPKNIDDLANKMILRAWSVASKVPKKRAILLSSIGVQRRTQMPFPILNACGVLDAKAEAEAALIQSAKDNGYSYTIVRPGQLFGGPYDNNFYLGTLFQLDKDAATQDIQVGLGDELLGDTLRSTLAEVTAQICETNSGLDCDFAVVNIKGPPPSVETLQERLSELSTPKQAA
jgi:nucleoside-diphosphate-sugar epimerase